MRVIICCYLLALVLGSNVTAEIIHVIVKEKTSASLPCPRSVEGEVTWSREINGSKVDILTINGDMDIRHNDPGKRFSSEANKLKSLHIRRTTMSDSGRYLCNNEAAVELTVIPSEASRLDATEGTSVCLTCPHVGALRMVTWSSRDFGDIQHQKGFYVSPVDQKLTITGVELGNSGLYYCDEKPAVYLNVIKGNKAPPTTTSVSTTTTTATTRQTSAAATTVSSTTPLSRTETTKTKKQKHKKNKKNNEKGDKTPTTGTKNTTTALPSVVTTGDKAAPTTTTTDTMTQTSAAATTVSSTSALPSVVTTVDRPSRSLVFGIAVSFLLLLIFIIIIVIVYCTRRRRFKRRGSKEICPVYDEIQDKLVCQPTNGLAGPTAANYCMTEFPDGSDGYNDPTYCTISDLPPVEKRSETSLPNECQYSLIGDTFNGGNNKDSSQLIDNLYFLLEQPKVP